MNGIAGRSTPSTYETVQWSSIVISWVNLFEKETIIEIRRLGLKKSKFFKETLLAIFEFNGMKDVSFKSSEDLTIKFIKDYFPEIIKEKRFNLKNDRDILVLASLLMYTTCIKCKIEDFVSKTCGIKLDDNHQEEAMKKFFEQMLTVTDGNFTRRTIMNAIQNSFDPIAVTGARKSLSPSVSRNCLKEFLGSPLLQEKYLKIKEENDIKQENEEENSELLSDKETLAKKIEELKASINKLKSNIQEKNEEINFLREELGQYENRELTEKSCNNSVKYSNEEIDQLKIDLKELKSLNENLLLENEKYIKQMEMKERKLQQIKRILSDETLHTPTPQSLDTPATNYYNLPTPSTDSMVTPSSVTVRRQGVTSLTDYIQFKAFPGTPLNHIFTAAGDDHLDLIAGLLSLNPLNRLTCSEALQMPYFSNKPTPSLGHQLPLPSNIVSQEPQRPSLKRKLADKEGGVQPKKLMFDTTF